jgi:hypothetical protein
MYAEYQIDGCATLRACPESEEIVRELRLIFDAEGAVKMERAEKEITLCLSFCSSNSPSLGKLARLLDRMKLFGVGAGFFDCEYEGGRWVEYVGDPDECRKLESAEALLDIEALLPRLIASDRKQLIELNHLDADPPEARDDPRAGGYFGVHIIAEE